MRAADFLDRVLAFFGGDKDVPPLEVVQRLDRELDKVGIHTAQDVRLLRTLGVSKGRAGQLAQGLEQRALEAVEEFEERLRRVERVMLTGETPRGTLSQLEQAFPRLARAVKVADIFAEPERDDADAFEIFPRPALPGPTARPASARVAVAEFWAQRARANAVDVVQKRRDLDAAHELLLRLGSDFDRDRVRLLRTEVAAAREQARAAPAARSLQELVRQVRGAARQDPRAAYRTLRGLYERAVEANDAALAGAASAALRPLLPSAPALRGMIEYADGAETREWIGAPAVWAEQAKPRLGEAKEADDPLMKLAFSLDEARQEMFELAAGCARFFDVDEALAEEDTEAQWVAEQRRRGPRRVSYPTQRMTFETTNTLHEVHNFVLTDPRTFVYDLASNRLPVRAYLDEEPPPRPKKVKRTAVRVYVCDASGSMHGARARFRDALIIAELNNLRRKALAGQPVDPLYFSFFNDKPTELTRVETAADATRHIENLFQDSPAYGQTHITLALMSAFDSIRSAQGKDPYLARATVVLVTDGEDRVDLELIRATRAPLGALEIAMSFISLGEENPDLKSLVLEQRKGGGRAFYHHLSDREISAARTEFDLGPRTLLPRDIPPGAASLELLLPHLDALEKLASGRAPERYARPEVSFDALFPENPGELPKVEIPLKGELDRVADILDAIAEAGSLAPADTRGGESVTLLNHLLSLYALTLPRYLNILAAAPDGPVRENLARVRLICRPFG